MIAFLRGFLVERGADWVIVDVAGVGYQVQVSLQTLAALPGVEEPTCVLIHSHQAQDRPLELYGFATASERTLFELLISVHGVGPKMAQALLSGFSGGVLEQAIARRDVTSLRRVRGVGGKTAERIVLELKDKVAVVQGATSAQSRLVTETLHHPDLVQALVGLGYKAAEAERAVAKTVRNLGEASTEMLLREALKDMQAR